MQNVTQRRTGVPQSREMSQVVDGSQESVNFGSMLVPGSAHLGEYHEKMVRHVYKEELVRTVMGVLFRIENIVSTLNSDNRRLAKDIVVPSTDMRERVRCSQEKVKECLLTGENGQAYLYTRTP